MIVFKSVLNQNLSFMIKNLVVSVKKKGFKPFDGGGQIVSGTGLSVAVRFEVDPNQE